MINLKNEYMSRRNKIWCSLTDTMLETKKKKARCNEQEPKMAKLPKELI